MELPKDPMMLFSVINMKLRDCYSSLDELCEDMNVNKDELVNQLKAAGFEYSAEHNKFCLLYTSRTNRVKPKAITIPIKGARKMKAAILRMILS